MTAAVAIAVAGTFSITIVLVVVFVRQLQERKDEEKAERLRQKVTQSLSEVFMAASKDGVMEKQDYIEIISSPYFLRKLQSVANMRPIPDLLRMFDWLDVTNKGSINQEDFMAGFDWLNENVTGKSLLKLQTSARHRCRKIETRAQALRHEIDAADGMIARRTQEMETILSDVLQRIEDKLLAYLVIYAFLGFGFQSV
ncbi:hypothetical protein AK812_SmicGene36927 [Symbiodinium microadriaticum]|uniref:EF-hand domain-containing protein n=1 Tax=Symbiodinium microadriaticum TaxID=2951 RepID=A0A1Q9CHK6_SYMMI|nr:hypothetical protein AK812_SmicGene36927 [Symbiodinium microadriaticum]